MIPVLVGVVDQNKAYLPLELLKKLLDGRTGRLAVRSLEIEKFHDGDRGLLGSQIRTPGDVDVDPLLFRRRRQRQSEAEEYRQQDSASHDFLLYT
jgi:hypothetical protein